MTDNVPSSLEAAEGRHAGAAPYVLAFDTANEVIALGLGRLLAQGMPGEDAPTVDVVLSLEVEARRASNTQLLPRIDAALAAQGVREERDRVRCVRARPGIVHRRAHCAGHGQGHGVGARRALGGRVVARRGGVGRVARGCARPDAGGGRRHAQRGVSRAVRRVRCGHRPLGGRPRREGRRGGRRAVCRSVRLPAGCGRRAAQVRGTVCAVRHAASGRAVGAHGSRPAAGAAGGMARRRSRSLRRAPARPCFRVARVHAPFRRRGERTSPSGEERPEEPDRRRAGRLDPQRRGHGGFDACGRCQRLDVACLRAHDHARCLHPRCAGRRRGRHVPASGRRTRRRGGRAGSLRHGIRRLERGPGGRRADPSRPCMVDGGGGSGSVPADGVGRRCWLGRPAPAWLRRRVGGRRGPADSQGGRGAGRASAWSGARASGPRGGRCARPGCKHVFARSARRQPRRAGVLRGLGLQGHRHASALLFRPRGRRHHGRPAASCRPRRGRHGAAGRRCPHRCGVDRRIGANCRKSHFVYGFRFLFAVSPGRNPRSQFFYA